jgi:glycosyltransferase involved in cell wall biosynthesis
VAYIYVTLATGGAERHLQALLGRLDRRRFDPRVICLGEAGEIGDALRAAGIPVRAFGLPRHGLWRPTGLLRVASHLRRERVAIAHTHMYHANTYGRLAALLAGTPRIVATVHTTGGHRLRKQRLMNRLLDPFSDRTIVVSEQARRVLVAEGGICRAKTRVIHNGVEPDRFRPSGCRGRVREALGIRPDALVTIVVARLETEKRHADLLQALRQVRAGEPRACLLVVGDGSRATALRAEADALGLRDAVVFTGRRDDVPDLLQAADVFALPSEREGSPLSVLEAMAAGLPVVAAAVGGVPEMVGPDAGVLCAPGRVGELAASLARLLADPARRTAMGERGRARVEAEFSAERMAAAVQSVYEGCLARARDNHRMPNTTRPTFPI